ncbi:MAG: hypothetical protein K0R26_300 [Bacteroidota bacterium]|jgi:hypothetical protein|nr:hypothetical protein [Bacteroidota bacterium]
MNTLRNKFWALLLITPVAFLSCKKDDQLSPVINSSTTVNNQPNTAEYKWKVSSYNIGRVSETNALNQYKFKITDTGIESWKDNLVEKGTWALAQDSVTINFSNTANLAKLNQRWKVVNISPKKITLEHLNKEGEKISVNFSSAVDAGENPNQGFNPEIAEPTIIDNTNSQP